MISPSERQAVERLFREAGYTDELFVAPVTSEDERVFVVTPGTEVAGRRDLEARLQSALGRKVWIVEQSAAWANREPLN